jgi:hypothetical protein
MMHFLHTIRITHNLHILHTLYILHILPIISSLSVFTSFITFHIFILILFSCATMAARLDACQPPSYTSTAHQLKSSSVLHTGADASCASGRDRDDTLRPSRCERIVGLMRTPHIAESTRAASHRADGDAHYAVDLRIVDARNSKGNPPPALAFDPNFPDPVCGDAALSSGLLPSYGDTRRACVGSVPKDEFRLRDRWGQDTVASVSAGPRHFTLLHRHYPLLRNAVASTLE